MTPDPHEMAKEVFDLVDQIRPLIAGRPHPVQGAALANLLSMWIAGHRPDIREDVLAIHVRTVEKLVAASERQIFGPGGWKVPGNA